MKLVLINLYSIRRKLKNYFYQYLIIKDSFLRSRRIDDHECTSTMKTQFMTMWDGLTTSSQHNNRILIIGATNRPEDVDPAILRRMPQMFHIGLPVIFKSIRFQSYLHTEKIFNIFLTKNKLRIKYNELRF